MNTEEIVKKVLTEQNCKDNDIIFLLQCWREQGCRAYFNYTDLFKADSPKKLLELKELFLKEGDKHSETSEIKPVVEEKKPVKATPKLKKKAEKEVPNKPVGSKIEDD